MCPAPRGSQDDRKPASYRGDLRNPGASDQPGRRPDFCRARLAMKVSTDAASRCFTPPGNIQEHLFQVIAAVTANKLQRRAVVHDAALFKHQHLAA